MYKVRIKCLPCCNLGLVYLSRFLTDFYKMINLQMEILLSRKYHVCCHA